MKKKLTKRAIDSIQPTSKDLFVWDTDLSGFGMKITKLGTRVFILQYRVTGFGVRRYTIGSYGTWTLELARKEAIRILGLVSTGQDPAEVKQQGKDSITFKVFAARYLKEYAEPFKKPSSAEQDRRNLEKLILPVLGARRLEKIIRSDIAKIHFGLRHIPTGSNRCLALLTTMFSLAEQWGLRPDGSNPCKHIKKYKERKRERFLSQKELAQLGDTLREAETRKAHSPQVIAAFRLLLFTGCRLGEILSVKWEHVVPEAHCLRLPDSKTGAKSIYLNSAALEVLTSQIRIENNPFVLPGGKRGSHLANIQTAWRVIRKDANIEDVRIHDLRHCFASVGAGIGLGLPVIGALLGHHQASTTQRYAHLSADPLKQAAELIGQKISAAMTSTPNAPVATSRENERASRNS